MDQLVPRLYMRLFLVFRMDASEVDVAVEKLNTGLQRTCTQIPYLKGRLSQLHKRGLLYVSWSDEDMPAVRRVESSLDAKSLAELEAEGMPTKELPQSLFPVGLVGDPSFMIEVPVLAASCTTIPGALVVGVCVHHNVMDGHGLGSVIRTWAISCRQGGNCTQIPALDHLAERWDRLKGSFQLQQGEVAPKDDDLEELLKRHAELHLIPVPGHAEPPSPSSTAHAEAPASSEIFRLRSEQLEHLKEDLESFVSPTALTDFNILAALFWTLLSRVRFVRQTKNYPAVAKASYSISSTLWTMISCRQHLAAEDSYEGPYFGNLALPAFTSLTLAELIPSHDTERPGPELQQQAPMLKLLSRVIESIAKSASQITSQYTTDIISIARMVPDVRTVQFQLQSRSGRNLFITSLGRLPYYSDFGSQLGKPCSVRPAPPPEISDGFVTILPQDTAVGREGYVEVRIELNCEDMDELKRDPMLQQ